MLASYETEGNETEMRKYRSITDGPRAAELLDDLKKRVYETRDKVKCYLYLEKSAPERNDPYWTSIF